MKRRFFQAAVVSILLHGCTTWTLTKRPEKKLDGNYTRMLRAILNKSGRQHPIKQQLYGHLPPITKTIQIKRTRHAGLCWRSRDELISYILLRTTTYDQTKAGRLARTYSSYVRIRDVALKTSQWWWTIGRSGERGPGISVLAARHDCIYIPITKTIQVRRTRHAGHCWRSRDELIRDVLLWIPTHGRAKAGRPARTYIQQLCEDTGCCPEDLPRAMNDREEWRERVRDIRATSAIWWWWYIYLSCCTTAHHYG